MWLLFLKYWWVLALAAVVTYLGFRVYDAGQEDIQKKWDASVARGIIEVEKLKKKQVVVTTRVETETIEVIRYVKEKGDVIIKKVPVYIPAGTPDLPLGFFVLNNAAAKGELPDATGFADGSTIAAQDFAAGVVENYTICRANSAQLEGLQTWVREQQALNP